MNIDMPSRDERNQSIRAILDAALPVKRTLPGEIKRLFNTVGLKRAFCGVGDAVAAALMVSQGGLLTVSIYIAITNDGFYAHTFYFIPVMLFAPVLYFSMLIFTTWKERMTGTWEVIASCRYNMKYVTAIRVMLVSAAGMVFIPLTTLPLISTAQYPNIIAAAFCAMFLYSALSLLTLLISESLIFQFAAPVMWSVGWGLALVVYSPLRVENFLANVPIVFSAVTACLLLSLYLFELRIFIMRATRRVAFA
jgi:hypothetical protein